MRGLIRFNLPTGLAGRIQVTGVLVQKTLVKLPSGKPFSAGDTYFLERLTQAFNQGTGCGAQSVTNYNAGAACTTGATWNTTNCATAWTSVGGSVTGAPVSAIGAAGGSVVWDSGSSGTTCAGQNQLCLDLQSWIDSGNVFGWRIRDPETTNKSANAMSRSGSLNFNFVCKAGFKEIANQCTTCTDAANAACVTSVSGNSCNDSGPPSTVNSCTCNGSGYKAGPGGTSCVPACTATTCKENGDASAVCTNTATGFTCGCDVGFVSNGTSCVAGCNLANPTPQPCGNGGTCNTSDGGNTWTCSCPAGYVSSGGSTPSCVELNACDVTSNAACAITQSGNTCVDEAAPSVDYHCSCNNPAYALGTVGGKSTCIDKNECTPTNHCRDNGDPTATCSDHVAPASGYDCSCSTGFNPDGVSCISNCGSGPDPCGNGGSCSVSGAGWTCSCPVGYASNAGVQATCIDKNECSPNACRNGGDNDATCVDHVAPAVGYDCVCSSARWTSSGITCVDKDECSGSNPCINGTCANVAAGGGYSCACNPGYISTGGTNPSCIATDGGVVVDAGSGVDSGGVIEADASADSGGAPRNDSGVSPQDSGLNNGGNSGDSGADQGGPSADDSGCSCRTQPRGSSFGAVLAVLAAVLVRMRRSRSQRTNERR